MKQKGSRNTIEYYWKVWKRIVRGSLARGYIYKKELVISFARSVYIVLAQVILLNVIFLDTQMYVGWSKSEAYLVIGIWNILNYVGWAMFGINLIRLESSVIDGSFDYTLLKPVSSSWMASFGDFFIYNLSSVFSGLVLVLYYIADNLGNITLLDVCFGLLSMCVGFFIWYSIFLIFASFTISSPKNGLLAVAKELLGITKYPIDVFKDVGDILFCGIIPLAFLTTVPAKFFMGEAFFKNILYGFVIGIVLYLIGKYLWKFNVRKYSSTGS